jgi:hypothetical protein
MHKPMFDRSQKANCLDPRDPWLSDIGQSKVLQPLNENPRQFRHVYFYVAALRCRLDPFYD